MIFPTNFEDKLGFNLIRKQLKEECLSPLGHKRVDRMAFMTNYQQIRTHLHLKQEFERILKEQLDFPIDFYFDLKVFLVKIKPEGTYLTEKELFNLKRSLKTISDVVKFCNSTDDKDGDNSNVFRFPFLQKLTLNIAVFPSLIQAIEKLINQFGEMKSSASPKLAQIRKEISSTEKSISSSIQHLLKKGQKDGYISKDTTPSIRDGRLVIPITADQKSKLGSFIVHDESATGKTLFIEPTNVVEANNRIHLLKAEEKAEIIRILILITNEIRPHITSIIASLNFLAEIDFIRAGACLGIKMNANYLMPSSFPIIEWEKARHPILEQSLKKIGKEISPLNIKIQKTQRILLISGPNAGGKSVCLKTVGLLQYMLQCGMPIPIEEASKAGTFNSIFIDIGDEQNIENELSTYSSHLLNMKKMMKYADNKGLILIDEFGGGTEPQIGGAIAQAMLQKFIENGTYGVITTHYQSLKNFAEDHKYIINGAMLYDQHEMRPLFTLEIGNPGSSFAISIARKIGIPEEIITNARNLVGEDYVQSDKFLQNITRDKRYWENKRKNIAEKDIRLNKTIEQYEFEIEKIQNERKRIIEKAKAEALKMIEDSNAKIENTIRNIKEAQAEKEKTHSARTELDNFKELLNNEEFEKVNDSIKKKIEQLKRRKERYQERRAHNKLQEPIVTVKNNQSPATNQPQEGDSVRIKGQSTVGTLTQKKGKNAVVVFGTMRTIIDYKRLEKAKSTSKEDNKKKVATFVSKETRDSIYNMKLNFKLDLDVRGQHGDEALSSVTYFIDDAIVLGIEKVRILHGTGTGALRILIRDYLASLSGVKSYKDEHVQFGGAGITVVELM